MAVYFDKDPSEKKASSLSGDTLTPLSRTTETTAKRGKDRLKDRTLKRKKTFSVRGLVVDLILLLILAGICVGGVVGYHAVKELYAPTWDTRAIEFCVEIKNIDYDRADQLLPVLLDRGLWYSDDVDGDLLGTVNDVHIEASVTEDGRETMTLYLTVKTTAKYRKGEGYYVGSNRLLAGETGVFRAEGLIAEGKVISLKDVTEVDA